MLFYSVYLLANVGTFYSYHKNLPSPKEEVGFTDFFGEICPGFSGFLNKNPYFHTDFQKWSTHAPKVHTFLFSHPGFLGKFSTSGIPDSLYTWHWHPLWGGGGGHNLSGMSGIAQCYVAVYIGLLPSPCSSFNLVWFSSHLENLVLEYRDQELSWTLHTCITNKSFRDNITNLWHIVHPDDLITNAKRAPRSHSRFALAAEVHLDGLMT